MKFVLLHIIKVVLYLNNINPKKPAPINNMNKLPMYKFKFSLKSR